MDEIDSSCRPFSSDAKIRVDKTNHTFYPDLSVVCGPIETSEKDSNALINSIFIVEVLSESSSDYDRGAKFAHYRQIPSCREYLLVSQNEVQVDVFYRTEEGTWEINTVSDLDQLILLKSLGGSIQVSDIYRRVEGLS